MNLELLEDSEQEELVYDIVSNELDRLESDWRKITRDETSLNLFCEKICRVLEISIEEIYFENLQLGTERAIKDFKNDIKNSYIGEDERRIARRIIRVLPFIKETLMNSFTRIMDKNNSEEI